MLKNKTLYISITLFLLIFCILGLPFTQWGFKTDDWGNVYHSIFKSWKDFWWYFSHNSEACCNPTAQPISDQAFLQGLYRPVSFIYYYLQYCIFGYAPYGFYLVTIGFHALNSVLLFNLLLNITTYTPATIAALLFGFHPSLWIWLGWTSAQTYQIELFTLLVIFLLLLAFLKHKSLWSYYLACLLFLINLFLKEQTIFFPFWLLGGLWIYHKAAKKNSPPVSCYIKTLAPFWGITLFYILVRLHFFPFTNQTATLTFEPTWHSFITRMTSRIFDFVSYTNDMLGLSWLGQGNQLLKGSIITSIVFLCALLFISNTKKLYIVFALVSIPIFSWPALIMHYQPRYIYMALPWTLCIGIILIQYNSLLTNHNKKILSFFFAGLICFNAWFLVKHLHEREHVLHTITTAFHQIINNPHTQNRHLCFICLPQPWFRQGTCQAAYMLRGDEKYNIWHYDAELCFATWPDKNFLHLTYKPDCIECTTTNPQNVCFIDAHENKKNTSTIHIPTDVLQKNPLFITWDYEKNMFRILDENIA
jgi:hypothetical protein